MALIERSYWPDGGDANNYPPEVDDALRVRARAEPRFQDPRVKILAMETGISEELDYGWSPRFSPDGDELAYARQVQPLTGQRTLAATLAGNEVVVRGRKTNDVTVWATPSRDHHLFVKRWVDGDTLLAEDHAAANGWVGDTVSGKLTKRGAAPLSNDAYDPLVFFSPNGEWILFTEGPGFSDVYISRLLSRHARRVWSGPGQLKLAAWSPDSRHIALIVSRVGENDPSTSYAGDELLVFEFPARPASTDVAPYVKMK